jgi:prepilin-type N-terminal cleavage/methylation domain-containing protein
VVRNEGITLIELIIVISIIGILVLALGFSFQGWIGGYNVESQIKEIYFDLMKTRARAMERNRTHFVSLLTTRYTVQEDISPWPDGDGLLTAGDNTLPTGYTDPIPFLQKNLDSRYPITWSDIADLQIDLTKKGLSNDTKTICSNTKADADYNCIELSASRINLGKLTTKIPDGGACLSGNCVAK